MSCFDLLNLKKSLFVNFRLLNCVIAILLTVAAKLAFAATYNTPPTPVIATIPSPSQTIDRAQGLEGSFTVTPAGQAKYRIPILTAPGSGGFAPAVSLVYSSGTGNSDLGVGWSLAAAGKISRCRSTESQDRNPAEITWSSSDRLCLNGERLVVDPGYTYGAVSSVYKTEIDQFSRITANGGTPGRPDYFTVEHKDGGVDFYGPSDGEVNSQHTLGAGKVLSWMLTKKVDTLGNAIKYNYGNVTIGEAPVLESIDYAFGSTATAASQIRFSWLSRTDISRGYIGGLQYTSNTKYISYIESINDGIQLRRYNFEYDGGGTPNDFHKRLTYVEECVNSYCRAPTTFDWSVPNLDSYLSASVSLSPSSFPQVPDFFSPKFSDINGDGLLDLVWIEVTTTTRRISYAFAKKDSAGHIVYEKQTLEGNGAIDVSYNQAKRTPPKITFLDYNADGRQDLAILERWGVHQLRVFLSKPQQDGSWKLASTPVITEPAESGFIQLLDINGDGLQDIVTKTKVRYLRSNGQGFSSPQLINNIVPQTLISPHCPTPIKSWREEVGDFNGDGRLDFVVIACTTGDANHARYEHHIYTSHLNSSGGVDLRFFSKLGEYFSLRPMSLTNCDFNDSDGPLTSSIGAGRIQVIDINKDGLSDIIGNGKHCEPSTYWISTGDGFLAERNRPMANNFYYQGPLYSDQNGDGHVDAVYIDPQVGFSVHFWLPYLNSFSTSGTLISNPDPNLELANTMFVDINGDGINDYVRIGLFEFDIRLNVLNHRPKGKILHVYEGGGQTINITYEPISTSRHYSRLTGVNAANMSETICESTDPGNLCWSRTKAASSSSNFYQSIYNPFGTFPSDHQWLDNSKFAVFENFNGRQIVTEASMFSPKAHKVNPGNVANQAKRTKKYYYEGARSQAGGRGFLGFSKVTTVDEMGQRKEVKYRQDWPFIGMVFESNTYSAAGLLKKIETYGGLVECYSGLTEIAGCITSMNILQSQEGTKGLGAVKPFVAKTKETRYNLNSGDVVGSLAAVVEVQRSNDSKDNLVLEKTSYGYGGTPLHVNEVTNDYTYDAYSYSASMGRLTLKTVISSQNGELGSDTITRQSSFGYYSSGVTKGLLAYEIIEPNNPIYYVRTDHFYNAGGMPIYSETTADGQTRRSQEKEYDIRNRFVEKTYDYFTSGENFTTPYRRLVSQVITRDRYKQPIETREFLTFGGSTYITQKIARTPFGTTYFTTDSTGTFTRVDAGPGRDSTGICPVGTNAWRKTSVVGGKTIVRCENVEGKVIREGISGFSPESWSVVDSEYRNDLLVHKSEPRFLTQSARWTSFLSMDSLGRPSTIHGPVREQDGDRPETVITYDDNVIRTTNDLGQTRTEEKNVLGNIASVTDPINGTTHYTYDARGNLRTMSDPTGNTTVMDYDLRDRKISLDEPNKGLLTYSYNSFNELVCQRDAKGQSVANVYDIRGRLRIQETRLPHSVCGSGQLEKTDTWRFGYDGFLNRVNNTNSLYHLSQVEYDDDYSYDTFGRNNYVWSYLYQRGENSYRNETHTRTTWDQYGRIFQKFDGEEFDMGDLSLPERKEGVQYFYSDTGYLKEIKNAAVVNSQQQLFYRVNSTDARGKVTSALYGNGVAHSASYYQDSGLVKNLVTMTPTALVELQDSLFTWDSLGNLKTRTETGGGTWIEQSLISRNITESFSYDNLNRLENWTTSGFLSSTESIVYNAVGDISTKSGVGLYLYGDQCIHTSNAGPNAVCRAGSVNYTYDDNGSMISDSSGRSIQYYGSGQASKITNSASSTEIHYRGNQTRFRRIDTVGGVKTVTLYAGNVEKIIYPDNSFVRKWSIPGVAVITMNYSAQGIQQSADTHYLHYDHLGSLSLTTNAQGFAERDLYFDPWGRERTVNPGSVQWGWTKSFLKADRPVSSRGFTGHEHLDEVSLIHMNGRIYDNKIARFIQADPIVQDHLRVQSLNRYSYVWNNPLNATDPSGFVRRNDDGSFIDPIDAMELELSLDLAESGDCGAGCKASIRHLSSELANNSTSELDYIRSALHSIEGEYGLSKNSLASGGGWIIGYTGSEGDSLTARFVYVENTFAARETIRQVGLTLDRDYTQGIPEPYKDILTAGNIDLNKNVADASAITRLDFIEAVRTNGDWDYKNSLNRLNIDKNILQRFGNFHFGLVAAAQGFSLEQSLYGAGFYQVVRQGGGSKINLSLSTHLMLFTHGGSYMPNSITRVITNSGLTWGDNEGDSIDIMQGWDHYDSFE